MPKCSVCESIAHNRRTCPFIDHTALNHAKNGKKQTSVEVTAASLPPVPERIHRYPEIFEQLAEPPDDALERTKWAQGILCTLARETAQGRGNQLLNNEIRRLLEAIVKITPKERLWEAESLIKRDRIKKKPKPAGPKTQKARPSKGPLR